MAVGISRRKLFSARAPTTVEHDRHAIVSAPSADHSYATYLDVGGKTAALAVVLLSPLGILIRWVSFSWSNDIANALYLASCESIPLLTLNGFGALFYGVISFTIALVLMRPAGDLAEAAPRVMKYFIRLPKWVIYGVFAVIIGMLVLFVPAWPASLLGVITGFFTFYLVRRIALSSGMLTFSHTWPVLVLFMALSGFGTGLSGTVAGVNRGVYIFSRDMLPRGAYLRMGEAGNLVYLKSCSIGSPVVAIRAESIDTIILRTRRSAHAARPSLWQIIAQNRSMTIGGMYICDPE